MAEREHPESVGFPSEWARERFGSLGPEWVAAIDYGIDVSLLHENLSLTPAERWRRLQQLGFRARFVDVSAFDTRTAPSNSRTASAAIRSSTVTSASSRICVRRLTMSSSIKPRSASVAGGRRAPANR